MRIRCLSLVLILAVVVSGSLLASIDSPDNPGKSVPGTAVPTGVTISCVDDVINTDFTCGNGLGPFTTEFQNIDSPDDYEYFRITCIPGDEVTVEIWRTTDAMDPAAHICEGDFCGMDNIGWADGECPTGSNLLDDADDNNGIPCNVGGDFSDPTMTFTCPDGGVATMAVYDFIGLGPTPEFEIHASGVVAPVPTMRPIALLALTLLMLMLAASVFGRM